LSGAELLHLERKEGSSVLFDLGHCVIRSAQTTRFPAGGQK
jgi:hypothetical protein